MLHIADVAGHFELLHSLPTAKLSQSLCGPACSYAGTHNILAHSRRVKPGIIGGNMCKSAEMKMYGPFKSSLYISAFSASRQSVSPMKKRIPWS